MADRPLSEEEITLWQRLVATVEPLEVARPRTARSISTGSAPKSTTPTVPPKGRVPPTRPVPLPTPSPPKDNLDSHWDRRIGKGRIEPDVTIDLHGMNLSAAYARLDSALELAIASGHRAILLIAGRQRNHDRASGQGRGAIRAALDDWLHASRHASHIAAVRNAHPRHGGAGALYIILKRRR